MYVPGILLGGIYPSELETYVHQNPCLLISKGTLFKVDKKCKQCIDPSRVDG